MQDETPTEVKTAAQLEEEERRRIRRAKRPKKLKSFPDQHRLSILDPFRWIGRGWKDFLRCPEVGLFYGACFTGMGWALMSVFEQAPAYTLALSAGFLLMGPFLCLGLYEASRLLELGQRPRLGLCLSIWRRHTSTLAVFGFVLLVLEMLWGRASLVVFAVSFDGMPDFKGSLLALLDPENIGFIVTYLVVGAVFASIIFSISVISIPMMLDLQTDAISAGLSSVRLVLTRPAVMFVWGGLLTFLVVLGLLPWFLGLLIIGPVTGHATWHCYRGTIVARQEADAQKPPPLD